jgi:predicted aspartyl protease
MESATMGRVLTQATIESTEDLWAVKKGLIKPEEARKIDVPDALVDTGATSLTLPTRLIRQLGLARTGTKRVLTSLGPTDAGIYETVRLTIQGRSCPMDVLEAPDSTPVLIGQVPLELLDFVVDPRNQKLIGNPAHGGELICDQY